MEGAVLSPTAAEATELEGKSLLRGAERDGREGRLRLALAGFLLLLATALLCTIVMEEDAEQLLPPDLLKNSKVALFWAAQNVRVWRVTAQNGDADSTSSAAEGVHSLLPNRKLAGSSSRLAANPNIAAARRAAASGSEH